MFNMILYILNPSRSNNPNNPKPPYSRKSYPRALHPWHCPMSLRCRWRLFRRPLPVVCRSLPDIVSQRPMGMPSLLATAAGENCALTAHHCFTQTPSIGCTPLPFYPAILPLTPQQASRLPAPASVQSTLSTEKTHVALLCSFFLP